MVNQQLKVYFMYFFFTKYIKVLFLNNLFTDNNYHFYVFRKVFYMDTVLFGGLGFLILCGICFLTIRLIDRSSLKDRSKRLFNYAVLGTLIIATILIFRWHSGTYLISN